MDLSERTSRRCNLMSVNCLIYRNAGHCRHQAVRDVSAGGNMSRHNSRRSQQQFGAAGVRPNSAASHRQRRGIGIDETDQVTKIS